MMHVSGHRGALLGRSLSWESREGPEEDEL